VADCVEISYKTATQFEWLKTLMFATLPAITYTKCYPTY